VDKIEELRNSGMLIDDWKNIKDLMHVRKRLVRLGFLREF
jgi:hypothetical protein